MKKGQRNKGGGKNKKKRANNKKSSGNNNNGRPKLLRFKYGDRVECLHIDVWETGTVIEAIVDSYDNIQILLDNGETIQTDNATKIRKSDSPPLQMIEFPIGTRIECKLGLKSDGKMWGEEWRLGEVIEADKDWVENEGFPYTIKFDDEEEVRHFIGPKDMIRRAPLRFGVGDRVEIINNELDLPNMPGTIVRLWPEHDHWEEGGIVPYATRRDDGELFYSRYDTDDWIISSDIPPVPVASFMKGDRVKWKADGMWRQGTVIQSHLDWAERDCPPFFIRFDKGKIQLIYGNDTNIRACDSDPPIRISEALKKLGLSDDESLFETPPPMPDCPICFLPLPVDEYQRINQACCGVAMCRGCEQVRWDAEGPEGTCPFCRAPELRSDEESVRLMRERVKLNDAELTLILGCQYHTGSSGLPKDRQKAHELFVRAADLGCPRACTNASLGFTVGDVVEKDEEKQMYYLEKGAKLGHVKARHQLGCVAAGKEEWDLANRHWKISASSGYQPSLDCLKTNYKLGMLSKEELTECLRAHQKTLAEEWSKDRAYAAANNDLEYL